jgi:glycosidase
LGISGLWLTGYLLSDTHHFYNIWTQYACIDPQRLDPSLGRGQDFRRLIDEAHRLNIRVFLDVITHGVMNKSPLMAAHPDWFKGSTWGMTDFDWRSAAPSLS